MKPKISIVAEIPYNTISLFFYETLPLITRLTPGNISNYELIKMLIKIAPSSKDLTEHLFQYK